MLYVEVNEDGTVGGSHQALYDLVKGLDRERFEPIVLFYQDNSFSARLRELGAEVHDYERERDWEARARRGSRPLIKAFDITIGAIARRFRFLRRHRIDLVHLNNSPAAGCDDWLPAAHLARIPCVTSVMSVAPEHVGFADRVLMRRFDAVLPVSRYICDDWSAAAGIPAERMHVVHHGVDLDLLRARVTRTPPQVRADLGCSEDRVFVLMVANLRRWKGQHVLLEALSMLESPTRKRLFTAFAGGAGEEHREYVSSLEELVRRHGLEDQVSFLGPRDDVPDLLSAADIAVHASVRPEPGGIAVLEAMALGTAVVAADVGGHVEAMTPGVGRTFDTSDPSSLARHLSELVADEDLRRGMGAEGRARMAEFSIERNVYQTEQVYDKVLA